MKKLFFALLTALAFSSMAFAAEATVDTTDLQNVEIVQVMDSADMTVDAQPLSDEVLDEVEGGDTVIVIVYDDGTVVIIRIQ